VLSAFGTLVTPARLDLVRGGLCRLDDIDWREVDTIINDMIEEGTEALIEAGLARDSVLYEFASDMRYLGQQNEVTAHFDADPRQSRDTKALRAKFENSYEALYGVRLDDMDVEVVSWRVTARGGSTGREAKVALAAAPAKPRTRRSVYIERQPVKVPVYDRNTLAQGQRLDGPVIVEERETTVFVLPNWQLSVHADGSLIATRRQ